MTLRYEKRIIRAMLRAEPATLFVFGDNLTGRGLGGQAREMRGEPNAVGIPTKRAPHMGEDAFFTDAHFLDFADAITSPFRRAADCIRSGGEVVWPEAGIGTGLADLERRAPRCWRHLERCRMRLQEIAESCEPEMRRP